MRAAPWTVLGILVPLGGFMVFDGLRALIVGDYLTPSSGPYAGQLGPWAALVSAMGIDPRADVMKVLFVIWGADVLVLAALHVHRPGRWWFPLTVVTFLTAWYLVIGTVLALAAGGILVSRWGRPKA